MRIDAEQVENHCNYGYESVQVLLSGKVLVRRKDKAHVFAQPFNPLSLALRQRQRTLRFGSFHSLDRRFLVKLPLVDLLLVAEELLALSERMA